jgi:hypothetical protein
MSGEGVQRVTGMGQCSDDEVAKANLVIFNLRTTNRELNIKTLNRDSGKVARALP